MIVSLQEATTWLASQPPMVGAYEVQSLPAPTFACEGKLYVSFSSNNYLGLAQAGRLKDAARRGLERYGVGNCESRLLTGDLDIYRALEAKLAHVKRKDAALLFATGYLANLGVLSALVRWPIMARMLGYRPGRQHKYAFFSDEFNHVSIKEGIRLSGATAVTYRHVDLDDLAGKLAATSADIRIIATDGVFSQDGDIAPLPEILRLADRYDAAVYVDDAHGTGVLGARGHGTSEHLDVESPRLIQMGTLSKAYGAIGGFVATSQEAVEVLRLSCSAFGFTSTLPPDQALAVSEAIDMVADEPERRARLWDNQRYFVERLRRIGLTPICAATPIVPILVGDDRDADAVAAALRLGGVHVDVVKFPAVGLGRSRLRVMLNAGHTPSQIETLIALLEAQARLGRLDQAGG
jgi:8-amino-7-oxononanoate synthase